MPDAGGLDQATPPRQRPWDEGVAVPLPADAGFTDAEHWAWSQIIRGEIADMGLSTGKYDDAGEDANEEVEDANGKRTLKLWPTTRKLSARFFQTILFHEPWASAKAKPRARICHAWVPDQLDWANADIKDEIWLYQSRIDTQPDWQNARFAGSVNLEGARLAQGLDADGLEVNADLFCRKGFKAVGKLRLLGVRIGGDASFVGAALMEGLDADGMQVGGGFFCRDGFEADGDVRLLGARIGGDADFENATLTQRLVADGVQIEGSLFCRGGFRAGSQIRLLGARIGGTAQFVGARVDDMVDLTSATIAGELQFDQGGEYPPSWSPEARLVLRNVTCGALAGAFASFRRSDPRGKRSFSVPVDLLGFSYTRIGGLVGDGAQSGATLADASARELIGLLQSDAPRKSTFTPQPYRQLADALMAAGREQTAHKIRRALLEHERVADGVPFTRKLALTLSGLLIGHGFASWRALLMFVALVIATAAIGLAYECRALVTSVTAMDFRAMGDWGGYALGNAIPILELDPDHKTFIKDRFGETTPLWLKTILYSSKLLGFVLLSYLAAGLSGFASRSTRS